jgi:hypothetical protein
MKPSTIRKRNRLDHEEIGPKSALSAACLQLESAFADREASGRSNCSENHDARYRPRLHAG